MFLPHTNPNSPNDPSCILQQTLLDDPMIPPRLLDDPIRLVLFRTSHSMESTMNQVRLVFEEMQMARYAHDTEVNVKALHKSYFAKDTGVPSLQQDTMDIGRILFRLDSRMTRLEKMFGLDSGGGSRRGSGSTAGGRVAAGSLVWSTEPREASWGEGPVEGFRGGGGPLGRTILRGDEELKQKFDRAASMGQPRFAYV